MFRFVFDPSPFLLRPQCPSVSRTDPERHYHEGTRRRLGGMPSASVPTTFLCRTVSFPTVTLPGGVLGKSWAETHLHLQYPSSHPVLSTCICINTLFEAFIPSHRYPEWQPHQQMSRMCFPSLSVRRMTRRVENRSAGSDRPSDISSPTRCGQFGGFDCTMCLRVVNKPR